MTAAKSIFHFLQSTKHPGKAIRFPQAWFLYHSIFICSKEKSRISSSIPYEKRNFTSEAGQ